jgi:hypothetical protein
VEVFADVGKTALTILQALDDIEQNALSILVLLGSVECICHGLLRYQKKCGRVCGWARFSFAISKGEKSRKSPAPAIPRRPTEA